MQRARQQAEKAVGKMWTEDMLGGADMEGLEEQWTVSDMVAVGEQR